MTSRIKTSVNSEIGKLEAVILHQPGSEVENMTPVNAERALYSDILNLPIASREYQQLKGVLDTVCTTLEVAGLLEEVLHSCESKNKLIAKICTNESVSELHPVLSEAQPKLLAKLLIEGIALEKNNLTNYLSNERFLLRPLHNLFFTRDSAMGLNDSMLIGKMANVVRDREALIMDAIFNSHELFETSVINPGEYTRHGKTVKSLTFEGGDFQVAREDVFVIGTGIRTSSQGIDFLIEQLQLDTTKKYHLIIQELPSSPESFIHLDMVFTFLDRDSCMVYNPIITELNKFRTIHIKIEGGKVAQISEQPNILIALKKLGIDLKPISCGGKEDLWVQEREQWHSGANFLAIAPGKVIGYERNSHTVDELHRNGYEVIKAIDIINGIKKVDDYSKCVITIVGSELARGGGGARCMTMPVRRSKL